MDSSIRRRRRAHLFRRNVPQDVPTTRRLRMRRPGNERFRGVRIFDISDLGNPRQVAAVQTCRGSHTHTLVVDRKDKANVYIYGQGTGRVRSTQELAGCSGETPEKDPNTALFSIDVIQVPLASPQRAKIVNRPSILAESRQRVI